MGNRSILKAVFFTAMEVLIGVAVNLLLVLIAYWLTGGVTSLRLSDYLFYDAGLLAFIAFCIWLGNVGGRSSWRYQAGGTTSRSATDLAHFAHQEEQSALSWGAVLMLVAGVMVVLSILVSEVL